MTVKKPFHSPFSRSCLAAALAVTVQSVAAAPVNYEMNMQTLSGMSAGGASGMMSMMFGGKSSSVSHLLNLRMVSPTDLPPDYSANHQVPDALRIGPVLPLKGVRRGSGASDSEGDPDGRVLIYWGCSPTVGKGQPEVLDFRNLSGKVSPEIMAMARQGRSMGKSGGRGAHEETLPPRALHWPNSDFDFKGIPDGASVVGEHVVKASFLTPDIRFTLNEGMDWLEPMNLKARASNTKVAIPLSWDALSRSRGYDLTGVGANGDKEVVLWLAAHGKSPMLPGNQRECTMPEGIFAKSEVVMVTAIAHGPTQGFAYPPQKPGEKKPLIWTATVRVKGFDSVMVGMEQAAGDAAVESAAPAGVGGLLKGIFGR